MSIAQPTRRSVLRVAGLGAAAAALPTATFGRAVAAPRSGAAEFLSGLREVIELGCEPMQRVFNADDNDIPWFGHDSQPELNGRSRFGYSGAHDESHVPGRHLLALLEASSIGVAVPEAAIRKHRDALYFSLGREVPLPQNRGAITDEQPRRLITHNIREGLHGLFALYAHAPTYSAQARQSFGRAVETIEEFWTPAGTWSHDALRSRQPDIEVIEWGSPQITGIGRAIGPLTRFWRLSVSRGEEHTAARALLDRVVEKTLPMFPASGINNGDLGTHTHSITCTLSGLANYAYEAGDDDVRARVLAFYRLGLTTIRDEFGWSIENTGDTSDRGECNNTGDILETALLLGHMGETVGYADAAQILRGHLMPAQLRDPSFMRSPRDPWDDSERDVGERLRGAFGFPAPYGHLPEGWKSVSFNLDIVGGAVSSLVFAQKAAVRRDDDGTVVVGLPVEHVSDLATVEVAQRNGRLDIRVRPQRTEDVRIALPQWADVSDIQVDGAHNWDVDEAATSILVRAVRAGRAMTARIRTHERTVHLGHTRRNIRALVVGDHVEAMDSHGTAEAFFPDFTAQRRDPVRDEVARWTFTDVEGDGVVPASSGLARHRLSLIAGATAGPLDGAPGGHALRLPGGGASATVGAPGDLNFGTGGLSIAV
ncbi:MAG: hypothetical protein GEU96_15045, partial [Propionibacteriales bacterium]|nr:hypothetical protein [Propionibacteriales bacterium]